jgi:hypothetical protein
MPFVREVFVPGPFYPMHENARRFDTFFNAGVSESSAHSTAPAAI